VEWSKENGTFIYMPFMGVGALYECVLLVLMLKKLHGLSPRANYTDQATVACRRSDANLCG
jgi:hypothetical protein